MKEECVLPKSYDLHKSVQLLPDRVIDTTNRSTVLAAKVNRFDPDGFRDGRPLQRALFYMDPCITCSWCNFMSFLDVMAIRRAIAMPKDLSKSLGLPPEALPPCRRCGKADHLEVGSHDFSEIIANREKVAREKLERETHAVLVLQRSYRAYLRRMYGHAASLSRLALARLQSKAATRINATARRRLARRRYVAEKHLRVIKDAHPVLLRHALKPVANRIKTFWFVRPVELEWVFKDYVGLAERIGYKPSRKEMEANFAEISHRIMLRKHELLILVQRGWRGVMVRRIVKYFRTEVIRLKQFIIARVLRIQRTFRGHFARRVEVPKEKAEQGREKTMDGYLAETEQRRVAKTRNDIMIKAKAAYIKERMVERSARLTSRIDLASDHQVRREG